MFGLTSLGRRWSRACRVSHDTSDRLIRQRRAKLEGRVDDVAQGKHGSNFLNILMSAKTDSSLTKLSNLNIHNKVDTFLFAGHHTTSDALAMVTYCLARHPEYQHRAQRDIDRFMQDREGDTPLIDDVRNECQLLDWCIKESMRLFPPVPLINRKAGEELLLGGNVIPVDTPLVLHIHCLHHDEKWWPNPETFKPERFENGVPIPLPSSPSQRGIDPALARPLLI